MDDWFLDSGFAIALANRRDQFHNAAVRLADDLRQNPKRLVTTHAVLLEIGNSLSKRLFRPAAVQLLSSMRADPSIDIVSMDETLLAEGLELFGNRLDKEWSLTDCVSIVVMTRRNIASVLTADHHFSQAGFVALMKP